MILRRHSRGLCLAFGNNYVKQKEEDTATQSATKMLAGDFSFQRHRFMRILIRYGSHVRPIFNAISCLVCRSFTN